MFRINLIVGTLFFGLLGYTQASTIQGKIVDRHTGLPVGEAQISIGDKFGISDMKGSFEIEADEEMSLLVERVGYTPQTIKIIDVNNFVKVVLEVDPAVLPEIIVKGGLISKSLFEAPSNLSVYRAKQLNANGGGYVQHLLETIPNVNWAGGTARPRYMQIRGIGRRSQYAGGGPPDFSVGYIVDGIDMSGLGMGNMFDVEQVEIYRGPQSSSFGINALAGIINVQTTNPSFDLERKLNIETGSDGLLSGEVVLNQPFSDSFSIRFGYQFRGQDGFRSNQFFKRDNTNKRSEQIFRIKGRKINSEGFVHSLTMLHVNADNGYDMWAVDNNIELKTYSDRLGSDDLQINAIVLNSRFPLNNGRYSLISTTSILDSEIDYSYDGDWGNDQFWLAPPFRFNPEKEGWRYDFFDQTLRSRKSYSEEIRFVGSDIYGAKVVVGGYGKLQRESDKATGYLFSGLASSLECEFESNNIAVYTELERYINKNISFTVTGRFERSSLNYDGHSMTDVASEKVVHKKTDWLEGASLSAFWRMEKNRSFHFTVARGYRAGGVNQHPRLSVVNRPYNPEYILNAEVGYKMLGDNYRFVATAFHASRTDQQVDLSTQQDVGDPNSFFYYRTNATSGNNSGIEIETELQPHSNIRANLSGSFLHTHVDSFHYVDKMGRRAAGDRASAHAPRHRFRVGFDWNEANIGVFANTVWTYTSDFYFSDSHEQKSMSYELLEASIGYGFTTWKLMIWGRNILDERYATRGFFFGLEPPDYSDKLYKSYGDPRQFGIRISTMW